MIQNNKYYRLLRAILSSGVAFVINYGITLFLTPYIIKNAGIEAYGFVSLAKQATQYATIAMTAINAYATRYIAMEYHQGNLKRAEIYFSSVFWGNFGLGGGLCVAAFFIILFLEKVLKIPNEIVIDVKILFTFSFVGFYVTNVCSVFSSSAYIMDKLDLIGIIRGLSYLIEGLIIIALFSLCKTHIYYVGFSLLCAATVIGSGNIWIWKKYMPAIILKKESVSFDALKQLVVEGIWKSINSLGDALNTGLDLLICNFMLSTSAMGQVAVAKTIFSIFASLFYINNQAFQPMFLKSYAEKKIMRLTQELFLASKVSGFLANLGFAGFFSLGKLYYQLWIPNQNIPEVYKLTVICSITAVIVASMQPLYYVYTLTVKNKLPCIITVLGGLINVVSMYALIKYYNMGAYAVVWTTVFVMATIDFLFNPIYIAHALNKPYYTFYPCIGRNLLSCVLMVGAFSLVCLYVQPAGWYGLFLSVFLDVILGIVIHCVVVFRKDEIIQVLETLKNKKGIINE